MTEIDETQPPAEAPAVVAEPEPEHAPAETAQTKKLNHHSGYVHVGPGAAECECIKAVDRGGALVLMPDGSCTDPEHLHVWCRLPNQFERQDLATRGAAAAARKRKALNDPESNSRVILDGELEGIVHRGDASVLIAEIVGLHFLEDHLTAIAEVVEDHPEYEFIDDDKERLRVIEDMPEEERPEEEFLTLRKTISDHTQLVNETREQLEAPRKETLEGRPIEELVDIVRDQRIDGLCNTAHSEEYAKWEWYICTFKPKAPDKPGFPNERQYGSINDFIAAPAEALEAIADFLTKMEREGQVNLKGS
jgi:hypothetical protein